MVGHVEHFAAQLDVLSLCYEEVLCQANVQNMTGGTSDGALAGNCKGVKRGEQTGRLD